VLSAVLGEAERGGGDRMSLAIAGVFPGIPAVPKHKPVLYIIPSPVERQEERAPVACLDCRSRRAIEGRKYVRCAEHRKLQGELQRIRRKREREAR
jgi:hypothetical protein